jgi:hypothetical protein
LAEQRRSGSWRPFCPCFGFSSFGLIMERHLSQAYAR